MRKAACVILASLAALLASCKADPPPVAAPAPQATRIGSAAAPAATPTGQPSRLTPDKVTRLSPAEVHRKVKASEAMLVCAYTDAKKFAAMKLQGAVPRSELEGKLASLPRDKQIIFYCA